MISIARLAAKADTAIYYLEAIANDRDDYYVASGEVPGRWLGSGSALLGLDREVSPEDLRAILDGLDPRTGDALVGYRKNSGFDLTLSAPKSVSLLWGLGDRATAEQVVAAHDQAVLAALAYTGGLTVGENADRLRSTLVEDWFLEHNDGKHAVILALRRSDVDELNFRVRRLLHRHGQLGDRVIATHDADFCVGDRGLALRNDRRGVRDCVRPRRAPARSSNRAAAAVLQCRRRRFRCRP